MFRTSVCAIAALLVCACASPYVAIPYDRSAGGVAEVAMVDDSMPEAAIAYEVASVGSNLGLIGALVDAGIQMERQNAVNAALKGVAFDAEERLENRLISTLGTHGYTVAMLPPATRAKRDFLPAYPTGDSGADAYLDVAITQYGYMSSGFMQPFRPAVFAKVKLVSASSGSTLMENQIIYNPLNATAGVITIPPNPEYAFENRSALLADPARLAAGLDDAINQVADTAAQLLR